MNVARVRGMPWGMGDNAWCIPALRAVHKKYDAVYVETAWPQMFMGFDWVFPLLPSQDSEYASWTMFRESIESVSGWAQEPEESDDVWFQETGDTSTRLRWFYDFPDEPADMSFPILADWMVKANQWIKQELWERGCSDPMRNEVRRRPYVLMHIPTQKVGTPKKDPRFCEPNKFVYLYDEFRDDVRFFDVQRVVECENELLVTGDMPVIQSNGADVTTLWALTDIADAVITTDNHMLPLALALKKPTLYMAGNVPIPYLFDLRIDASKVELVAQHEHPIDGFRRIVERLNDC